MIGTIAGDILGSIYESWMFQATITEENVNTFNLFNSACIFTDDSVLTCATADAILSGASYREKYIEWFNKYPNRGWGSGFGDWVKNAKNNSKTNNSYGNGAMMRVGPIGMAFDKIEEVLEQAKLSAQNSHDSPEAIKGAQAIALATYLAKRKVEKNEIRKELEARFHYDLSPDNKTIRDTFNHRTTHCDVTGPQAICVFLNSDSYEATIRNAIYTQGDCDTICAIAGGLAQQYYRMIPNEIFFFTRRKMALEMFELAGKFHSKYD